MKTKRMLLAAVAASMLGSGCLSVNIGKPERFSKEFYGGEQTAGVISETCVSVEMTVDARQLGKGRIGIGLKGLVETETKREKVYKLLTVERQKILDFGFCPGWSEMLDFEGLERKNDGDEANLNSGSLTAMVGTCFEPDSKIYSNYMSGGVGWTFGSFLGMYLMVPYAVVVEPILGDWSCSTHHWILPGSVVGGMGGIQYFADETGERKTILELISSSPEFKPLGIKTYVNSGTQCQSAFASQFTHMALLGFHKRSKVRILPLEIVRREAVSGTDVRKETKTAVGPFRIHLEIPALNWRHSEDVPKGRGQAWFDLPAGVGAGTDINIHYEAPSGECAETTKLLLKEAKDASFSYAL